MANISKIAIGNKVYDVKDAYAREHLVEYSASAPQDLGASANVGQATTVARSDHVHKKPVYGNITTAGAITAASVTIANGDKLVIADSSNSSKLYTASITFDGSTETKFLSQKGTWLKPQSVPNGGKTGQILVKQSDTDGDVGWYSQGVSPVNEEWYLATGVNKANVVAAYKFVGADSETDAMTNLVNNYSNWTAAPYPLTKSASPDSPTWNTSTGFYFPSNTYLKTNCTHTSGTDDDGGGFNTISGANTYGNELVVIQSVVFGYRLTKTLTKMSSVGTTANNYMLYTMVGHGSQSTNWIPNPVIGKRIEDNQFMKAAINYERGVLGGTWGTTNKIYLNGMNLSLTQHSGRISISNHITFVVGQKPPRSEEDNNYIVPAYITAIAFYGTALSAAQHMQIYNNIKALGGGID